MQFERVNTKDLVVNSMPDGSRVIRSSNNETVFALNATAAAAWDACSSANSVAGVANEMRRSFDPNVTDELAEACILQFQEKNLVSISGSTPKHTRRAILAGLSAVALPLGSALPGASPRIPITRPGVSTSMMRISRRLSSTKAARSVTIS